MLFSFSKFFPESMLVLLFLKCCQSKSTDVAEPLTLTFFPRAKSHRHIKKGTHTPPCHTLSFSSFHRCEHKCRINVVLNLAFYKHSANASWVNRCPGCSILLSYKERQSCCFIYECDARARAPQRARAETHMPAQLEPDRSSRQADYEVLSCSAFRGSDSA